MSSRFYFTNSESGSDLSDNDDTSLPFPKPLDRSAFLSPDFDATVFLSSLSSRFQTLEDLQTELRELSQTLNKELIDLVNDNYQDFLNLGSTLSGGGDKIEDIRVGVLAFQRDVKGVRELVDRRREEVQELLDAKRSVRRDIGVGRALLEIAERVDNLEVKLDIVKSKPADSATTRENDDQQWSPEWMEDPVLNDSDDEYNSDETSSIPPRLKRRTEEFLILKHLVGRHGAQHPFILAQDGRIRKIQDVLLADLDGAIRREPEVRIKQQILQVRAAVEE